MPSPKLQPPPRPPCKVSPSPPLWLSILATVEDTELDPGQIAASLTSFSRTIDDYSETAKRELIPAKQEKAWERIKTFRVELADYRQYFDRLKQDREDSVSSSLLLTSLVHLCPPPHPYSFYKVHPER